MLTGHQGIVINEMCEEDKIEGLQYPDKASQTIKKRSSTTTSINSNICLYNILNWMARSSRTDFPPKPTDNTSCKSMIKSERIPNSIEQRKLGDFGLNKNRGLIIHTVENWLQKLL